MKSMDRASLAGLYECTECHKVFWSNIHLANHKEKEHKETAAKK